MPRFLPTIPKPITLVFLCLGVLSSVMAQENPEKISGRVMTPEGQPLPEASVQFQGQSPSVLTDKDGQFQIPKTDQHPLPPLTAGKAGYFNGELKLPATPIHIVLRPLPNEDHPEYRWIPPDPITNRWHRYWIGATHRIAKILGDERWIPRSGFQCGLCHKTLYGEWQEDPHSSSATDPVVMKFFEDTTAPAFHLDFPHSAGNCATCHAPADAASQPWQTDLTQLTPIGQKGVSCDVCHKVSNVIVDDSGGHPGVLSMKFKRPEGRHQIFLGPMPDVTAGPDSFSPLFKDSRFCASCHHAKFWGVLTYGSYDEWQQSPQAQKGTQCIDCHMKPSGQLTNLAPNHGGLERDPQTLATHQMKTGLDLDFFREALKTSHQARITSGRIRVTITLENSGAAHAIPTDFIGRNLILWVQARDESGKALSLLQGPTIPSWGGDVAGHPGKGFAKILIQNVKPSFTTSATRKIVLPAPHWLQISLSSDTRLFSNQPDHSLFEFSLPATARGATVQIKLLYRRLFYEWALHKNIPLTQLTLWETHQTLSVP